MFKTGIHFMTLEDILCEHQTTKYCSVVDIEHVPIALLILGKTFFSSITPFIYREPFDSTCLSQVHVYSRLLEL